LPDLLFLTQRLPYPPVKGEKIRAFEILKHLGRSFDIHLGCLIDDPTDWPYVDTVRAHCRDIHVAKLDRSRARMLCLRGLFTGQPLSVTYFEDGGLKRWVGGVLNRIKPEVLFVCSSNMAPYVLDHPHRGRVRLVDLVDVDSEKWRAYAERAGFPMGWVYGREARLTLALERRIAIETDYSAFVSTAEADLFRSLVPGCAQKIVEVSNGVDLAYFDPALPHPAPYDAAQPSYVFTGVMDYPPNVDAVEWFAREILPLIRKRLPTAQFYIVGANPAAAVSALAGIEGVHVTGRVPDVRPYMKHAAACVAPMRIARGIQNKVLQALAMGLPTIVTPGALEGIDAEPGRDVLMAADAEGFAAAAVEIAEPGKGQALGASAHRRMVEHYAWPARLAAFDRLLGTVQTARS
jgi:sugar transferase (PEP-CTERM/EpsH1 system associated)